MNQSQRIREELDVFGPEGFIDILVVGDRFQAAKAAADRGIAMAFQREIRDRTSIEGPRVFTVGRVSRSYMPDLEARKKDFVQTWAGVVQKGNAPVGVLAQIGVLS